MRSRAVALLAVLALAALLCGCSGSSTASDTTASTASPPTATDPASAALLPAAMRSSRTVVVGTNLAYPPNEFSQIGKPRGWEMDLLTALSRRLGLKVALKNNAFANVLPAVQHDAYDLGIASISDTKARQQQVDFIDYYSAGSQWAALDGTGVSNTSCGISVAAQTGTEQALRLLPAASKVCTDKGDKALTITTYATQQEVTEAVLNSQVKAMVADSPVVQAAIDSSSGLLIALGGVVDTAPYGIAVPKDQPALRSAVQHALQKLIDDGTYGRILARWKVTQGAVKTAAVNGGKA